MIEFIKGGLLGAGITIFIFACHYLAQGYY
jgi:hypothetical protein